MLAHQATAAQGQVSSSDKAHGGGRRMKMATLKVAGCRVNTTSITIFFSDAVDQTGVGPGYATSALNPANYAISVPAVGLVGQSPAPAWAIAIVGDRTVVISPPVQLFFPPGEVVTTTVKNIALASDPGFPAMAKADSVSCNVIDLSRGVRDVEDAVTYPLLTEQVSFPRSGGSPATGGSYPQNGAPLGQTAALAIGDVLGWKVSSTDPKGFVGALTQAFTLTDVEGHVQSKWNPRTFAVQTDLGGGISGAQASLYTRAKDALDQSLSLLDGLYPLDPDADPEYVKALREMARSQMTEIVKEFGTVGLPSILRIDTYFQILLGQRPTPDSVPIQFDPDKIGGTLGQLRTTYGVYFRGNPFNNSVEDEQDITNFRVISDYMTSLLQSWAANRDFFIVSPNRIAFFGTQLVLISRQLNVIAETVDEVRFALDSVFIGPNERQTLLLKFADRTLPPMFLEDIFEEIEKFVEDEGPRLLRDGGKISVTNNILPVVKSLKHMIKQAREPENKSVLPDGFKTARVRHALNDLHDQLGELIKLTEQVEQKVPLPEYALVINDISNATSDDANGYCFSIFGDNFDPDLILRINSAPTAAITPQWSFYSAQRVDVFLSQADLADLLLAGPSHDITITNPDGATETLVNAFSVAGPPPIVVTPLMDRKKGTERQSPLAPVTLGQLAVLSNQIQDANATFATQIHGMNGSLAAQLRQMSGNFATQLLDLGDRVSIVDSGVVDQLQGLGDRITTVDDNQALFATQLRQLKNKISAVDRKLKKPGPVRKKP
jgi:hypothetical protein